MCSACMGITSVSRCMYVHGVRVGLVDGCVVHVWVLRLCPGACTYMCVGGCGGNDVSRYVNVCVHVCGWVYMSWM